MAIATATRNTQDWRTVRFDVLERIESLPSLSNVVVEFLELARREFFTAKDFEAVICKDQALVARLLRLANSGIYGKPRSVRSVAEAVVLIGLNDMKKIVLILVVFAFLVYCASAGQSQEVSPEVSGLAWNPGI